jgi:hypothetical protein
MWSLPFHPKKNPNYLILGNETNPLGPRGLEEFCRSRWDMTKAYANRLISSVKIVENLTPIGVKPSSESQIRSLSKPLEAPRGFRASWS